jgi:hypothetical protein
MDKDFKNKARDELATIGPKIERLQKELERLKELKFALRTIVGDDEADTGSTHRAPGIVSSRMGIISKPKLSVLESVKAVVPAFGNQEFNAELVEAKLIEKEMLPDVSQPRSQITTALGKLVQKGYLERTFAPESGVQPHRFRLSDAYTEELNRDLI